MYSGEPPEPVRSYPIGGARRALKRRIELRPGRALGEKERAFGVRWTVQAGLTQFREKRTLTSF